MGWIPCSGTSMSKESKKNNKKKKKKMMMVMVMKTRNKPLDQLGPTTVTVSTWAGPMLLIFFSLSCSTFFTPWKPIPLHQCVRVFRSSNVQLLAQHFPSLPWAYPEKLKLSSSLSVKDNSQNSGSEHIATQTFNFHDLAMAIRNFRADYLLGEGGFRRVYKGRLENNQSTQQDGFQHPEPFVCCWRLAPHHFSPCTPPRRKNSNKKLDSGGDSKPSSSREKVK